MNRIKNYMFESEIIFQYQKRISFISDKEHRHKVPYTFLSLSAYMANRIAHNFHITSPKTKQSTNQLILNKFYKKRHTKITMGEENMESVEQKLRETRNRLAGDDREKTIVFSPSFLKELDANIQCKNTMVAKLSCEILMLLSLSAKKEIRAAITNINIVEQLKTQFNKNHMFIFIKTLRIILEGDSHNTIESYNFFYALLKKEGLPRNARDEVYRYFYNTHSTVENFDVKGLFKSKMGLLLLTRIINIQNINAEYMRKLLKVFKKVDLETKITIIESLEKLYHTFYRMKDEGLPSLLKQILKLIAKIINLEDKRSLIILSRIAEGNLEVQRQVLKVGLLDRICNLFLETKDNERSAPSIFFCLYAISNESEENRKNICKSRILPYIFYCFNSKTISRSYDTTFLAVLYLFRSLTRSVQFLRSGLIDFPILDSCINALESIRLKDARVDIYKLVLTRANNTYNTIDSILAVVSNLLLEYGNYKTFFYQKRALRVVIEMIDTFPYSTLFLFKNFVYDSSLAIKEHFLQETSSCFFKAIFTKHSGDPKVVEQCLNLIRNLCCEMDLELITTRYPDLMECLFEQFRRNIEKTQENVLIQLIYVFVNMATDKRLRHEIIKNLNIGSLMRCVEGRTTRIATVWLITNLTWKEYEDGIQNIKFLKDIGVVDWLESIQCGDPVLDEKIKTAIENIA